MKSIQLSDRFAEPLTDGNTARQLSFFDAADEAELYHSSGYQGFFALLLKARGENTRQHSYRLDALPKVLGLLPDDEDSWISQAEFRKPNRRVVNLARVGLSFVDLDTYRGERRIDRLPIDEQVEATLLHCGGEDLPSPTLIIHSGRGLQLKWLYKETVPRWALPRWNAVQWEVVNRLDRLGKDVKKGASGLGVDRGARDASRVLRLVNTTNMKSGDVVRVIHVTEDNGEPLMYDFDAFADQILPYSRAQIAEFRAEAKERAESRAERKAKFKLIKGEKSGNLRGFSGRQLAWHRLEDLRTLAQLRGGVQEGNRTLHLHWRLNFLLLSGATTSQQMYYEAEALAREIMPGWKHRPAELATLYEKAKQMEAGHTIEWNGRKYPPLYTPKNDTLIDLFGISDNEQRQLRTIISESLAKERHAERERARRAAAGAVSRAEYERRAQDKRAQARLLRAKGLTVREIAKEIGASLGAVSGYLKPT